MQTLNHPVSDGHPIAFVILPAVLSSNALRDKAAAAERSNPPSSCDATLWGIVDGAIRNMFPNLVEDVLMSTNSFYTPKANNLISWRRLRYSAQKQNGFASNPAIPRLSIKPVVIRSRNHSVEFLYHLVLLRRPSSLR